jgi:hypothetical protein
MAEKKLTKAQKRSKREKKERRIKNKEQAEIEAKEKYAREVNRTFCIISSKNERPNVKVFSEEEKLKYFTKPKAIGTTICPLCGNPKVFVANACGKNGDVHDDYIMTHITFRGSYDCDASGFLMRNLFNIKGV